MSEQHIALPGRGVELCFEEIGSPSHPLVLLVMGLGLDLCWWRDDFCAELAGRGLRVVRFDNRDVGRSTHFSGPGVSPLQFVRRRAKPVYSLEDMADDAGALIDALGVPAHVVGVSMGALIAQEIAIRHGASVKSLTSIMGRTGDGKNGTVAKRMMIEFLRPPARDPKEGIVRAFQRIGSVDRTAQDDEDARVAVRRSAARETGDGSGPGRQLAAIIAERDRTADLRALAMPALVIHGTRDRVIQPSGGRATAAAIPGAELLEIEGMGHDLPRWVWPQVIDGVAKLARGR